MLWFESFNGSFDNITIIGAQYRTAFLETGKGKPPLWFGIFQGTPSCQKVSHTDCVCEIYHAKAPEPNSPPKIEAETYFNMHQPRNRVKVRDVHSNKTLTISLSSLRRFYITPVSPARAGRTWCNGKSPYSRAHLRSAITMTS